jgi:hypothetical protein
MATVKKTHCILSLNVHLGNILSSNLVRQIFLFTVSFKLKITVLYTLTDKINAYFMYYL